jgi:hypothetical protein
VSERAACLSCLGDGGCSIWPCSVAVRLSGLRSASPRVVRSRARSATGMILMEYLQVFENRVELNIAQFFLGKVRHRTESMTDLESLQEVRKRFVIQCRAEAGFSARVTSIALFHERHLPGCGLFAEGGAGPSGGRLRAIPQTTPIRAVITSRAAAR